jgi:hypothetical protein
MKFDHNRFPDFRGRNGIATDLGDWLSLHPWDHFMTLSFDVFGQMHKEPRSEERDIGQSIGSEQTRKKTLYKAARDKGLFYRPLYNGPLVVSEMSAIKQFERGFLKGIGKLTPHSTRWFMAVESADGSTHIHALFHGTNSLTTRSIEKCWRGNTAIRIYDPKDFAAWYVTKGASLNHDAWQVSDKWFRKDLMAKELQTSLLGS